MEGVLNIYGLLIIIIISLTACCYVIYHYLTIKHLLTLKAPGEADLMPSSLLILYLLTVFVVLLPYTQNFHLRSDPGIWWDFRIWSLLIWCRQYVWRKLTTFLPFGKGKAMKKKVHIKPQIIGGEEWGEENVSNIFLFSVFSDINRYNQILFRIDQGKNTLSVSLWYAKSRSIRCTLFWIE